MKPLININTYNTLLGKMTGISTLHSLNLHREEAAGYVHEQTKWDSRRGLKRSWNSGSADPGEGSSSGHKAAPTEKGNLYE